MIVSFRPVRDATLMVAGVVVVTWQLLTGSVTLLLVGLGLLGAPAILRNAPVLRPDPVMPEGRRSGCVCRGCTRPGQRRLWERLANRPLSSVPRSHAQAMLGVEHGRLHDARRMECEAGIEHTAEVIAHFALPVEMWTEEEYDDCWGDMDAVKRGGCGEAPGMISLNWR